jgi:predicted O-methyltransferase YrrM
MTIEERIHSLDISLFDAIHSQTLPNEKEALLLLQSLHHKKSEYVYLEIGSFIGGTLQPHLLDQKCKKIYSIDKRVSQSNQKNNTVEFMLDSLKSIQEDISKIKTFECDTRDVPIRSISEKADLVFIDGWHSDEAVYSDFRASLKLCKQNAAIVFHDTYWIFNGILKIYKYLRENNLKFHKFLVGGSVSIILLQDNALFSNDYFRSHIRQK